METTVETIESPELSAYEIERGKPMPTLIHGAIQANLIIQIAVNHPNQFRIASEVLLDTQPLGSTPDLVLYPAMPLDYKDDPARRPDAPLMVAEIQSPSQSSKDMVAKLEPYFYFGVKSCWIVVPDFKAILVYNDPFNYRFFREGEVLQDTSLGIEMNLSGVFE